VTETSVKAIVAAAGTAVSYLLGGFDALLEALAVLVVADVLTGVLAAAVARDLDSGEMFRGTARKVLMFVLIAVAHQLDQVLGLGGDQPLLRTATIWFFVAHEGLSILENAGKAGLPLPGALTSALRRLQQNSGAGGQ